MDKKLVVVLALSLVACEGAVIHPDDPGQLRTLSDAGISTFDIGTYDAGPHWSSDTDVDQPFFVPGVVVDRLKAQPWVAGSLPLKFAIDSAIGENNLAVLDILQAVEILNDTAGGIVLERVSLAEPHTILVNYQMLPDGAGGWTHCDGDTFCYVSSTDFDWAAFHQSDLGIALWTHEFMHSLGYYAADGDIHDVGVMAPGIRYFDITPRHVAYLNALGQIAREEFLSPVSNN